MLFPMSVPALPELPAPMAMGNIAGASVFVHDGPSTRFPHLLTAGSMLFPSLGPGSLEMAALFATPVPCCGKHNRFQHSYAMHGASTRSILPNIA